VGLALPPLAVVFGGAAVMVGFRARAQATGVLGLFVGAIVLLFGLYMTTWLVLLFGFGIDIGLTRS
jgi:hypothetical protein